MKAIWIIGLFEEFFTPLLNCGVVGTALRGEREEKFQVNFINLKEYGLTNYKAVDDSPYGGGPGMILRADVLKSALLEGVVKAGGYGQDFKNKLAVIMPSPRGKVWSSDNCRQFARDFLDSQKGKDPVFICGRYEGIDERFIQQYVDLEYSIGDYVLTGGELAVMVMLDSALRFAPGVLGNKESAESESFNDSLLEHPQYTRPAEFDGIKVPDIFLSGHHKKIEEHKLFLRKELTKKHRPDLWKQYEDSI